MTQLATEYRAAIFADAYLQGIGALLSLIFFTGLVYLFGAGGRFANLMTVVASTTLLGLALGDVVFTIGAVNAASLGHSISAQMTFY